MTAKRAMLALLGLVLVLSAAPARAQLPLGLPASPAASPPPAATPAPTPTPTPERDVDALLRVLENDTARSALIARLKADTPTEPPAAEAPGLASQLAETTRQASQRATVLIDAARSMAANVVATLRSTAASDLSQVWNTILDIGTVMAAAFIAFALLRLAVTRLARRLAARGAGHGWPRRIALLVVQTLADTLSVALAAGAGYAFTSGTSVGAVGQTGFYQTLFLNAFIVVELGKVVLRAVLVPAATALRPLRLDDTDAAYWYFWSSRLASLLGYSFLFAAPLVLYASTWAAAQSVRLLAMVIATIIVVTVVLQNRTRVRAALAARRSNGHADMLGRIAAYLGTIWHLIAIGYAIAVLVVWLADPATALPFMLRATAQSVIAAVVGVLVVAVISAIILRFTRISPDLRARLPMLEGRLNAFIPAVLRAVRLIVLAGVLLAAAHVWHLVDVSTWLTTGSGRALVSTLASVGLVLLLGLALHLISASWVEYRLNPNYGTIPTPRERTLLALFRNAMTIALIVVVAMLLLSNLGINIAPLLAGAGVVGLAVGFGAQKLVQDIITGIFIQFENAMNEGEVVTAAGISGLVERLTIRSVSLRDLSGVLHVIPFSTVDKVSNMMRHFSCHLAEIGVAYNSDIPAVKAAMLEAFDRLQKTEHGAFILEPMEMYGLARFGDSALVVMGRFKTLPGKHWNAGRAYNEILKAVFDEHSIEIPFPQRTLHIAPTDFALRHLMPEAVKS
ncbi:MAG: mechanosensitive ion channel [Acetobacteraceae bacterium]|nr:mechanosensitive ion channel [Acetobacteraceae bacterium]